MGRPVNRERKMVSKEMESFSIDYSTLEDILAQTKRMIKSYGKDAKIFMRCERYSDSDKEYPYVYMDVPETDAEMTKRIADEEEWARRDDERDAAEFKRLQAKFGAK
jgi:hypothetical protein